MPEHCEACENLRLAALSFSPRLCEDELANHVGLILEAAIVGDGNLTNRAYRNLREWFQVYGPAYYQDTGIDGG